MEVDRNLDVDKRRSIHGVAFEDNIECDYCSQNVAEHIIKGENEDGYLCNICFELFLDKKIEIEL